MAIKVKDLKTDTVYYDDETNEILYIDSLTPLLGEDGIFMYIEAGNGLQFACYPSEATFINLIELGEL